MRYAFVARKRYFASTAAAAEPSVLREDLPRVQDPQRIEERLEPPLEHDDLPPLLVLEEVSLREADAVLAGDGAAEIDGGAQDRGDGAVHLRALRRPVIEHVAVQVPVSGMAVGR